MVDGSTTRSFIFLTLATLCMVVVNIGVFATNTDLLLMVIISFGLMSLFLGILAYWEKVKKKGILDADVVDNGFEDILGPVIFKEYNEMIKFINKKKPSFFSIRRYKEKVNDEQDNYLSKYDDSRDSNVEFNSGTIALWYALGYVEDLLAYYSAAVDKDLFIQQYKEQDSKYKMNEILRNMMDSVQDEDLRDELSYNGGVWKREKIDELKNSNRKEDLVALDKLTGVDGYYNVDTGFHKSDNLAEIKLKIIDNRYKFAGINEDIFKSTLDSDVLNALYPE